MMTLRELTTMRRRRFTAHVKHLVPLSGLMVMAAITASLTVSCTTLENRRDLYSPQKVQGPYTRMLKEGIPQPDPTPAPFGGTSVDGKAVVR